MTVVSRATSRRTRPGNNRRTPRGSRGPTRRTRSTKRYLVPALLSRTSDRPVSRKRADVRAAIVLWFLMAADLATVIWMYTLGEWLDHASKFTATATLGGHHYIVLTTAAVAFTTLAAVAILSDGFTRTTRALTIARTAACILSLTALTGLTALLLASLVARLLVGPLRP